MGINPTPTSKIILSKAILTGFLILVLLLSLGSSAALALTLEEEQKLGEQVVREVEAKFTVIRDPLLLNYLNRLGQEILQKSGSIPYPFRFYLLKDPQLNAFSVPGGHIFVTTGIVEVMDSEGELAGLLGHEIAHVTARHIAKRMEREKKISLATMAAVLASIFAGDPRIASAVITSSLATGISLSLKYSREDEEEADNYGFKYMTRDGYNPEEMAVLLSKLRKWGAFGSEAIPPYLLTHPGIGDRIEQIESLKKYYEKQGPWIKASSPEFRRFQVLLLAKYGNPLRARDRFRQWNSGPQAEFWIHYGQGWLNLRDNNFEGAIDEFEKALVLKPHDSFVLRDLGQAYLVKGNLDLAVKNLGQAALVNPQDPMAAFYLGRAYLEQGNNSLALENFQRAVRLGTEGDEVFQYLGTAYGNLGDLAQAHYNLGRFFQRRGDLGKAVFHYKTALKHAEKNPELKGTLEKEVKSLTSDKKKEEKPKPEPETQPGPSWPLPPRPRS
ncbi:MAG: M48 family metalloprotease [Deltaproteobacteria bacterium]|nr:M48 family metalloprotease [Deltaproteobacteria bacterium]